MSREVPHVGQAVNIDGLNCKLEVFHSPGGMRLLPVPEGHEVQPYVETKNRGLDTTQAYYLAYLDIMNNRSVYAYDANGKLIRIEDNHIPVASIGSY